MFSIVILALAATASASVLSERQSEACSATHIFIAKGNNEPYPGRQGVLVNAICDGLTGCTYEDILFYNPVTADYCAGNTEGLANGLAQMYAYNARCPDAALVLSGYSQGAQIVIDMLGGVTGLGCETTATTGIDPCSSTGQQLAAILVFGNPEHVANEPYNVISGAAATGIWPLPIGGFQLAAIAKYASVLHDYCAVTDPICASGDVIADHLNYFDLYTDDAAAWVKSQLLVFASKPANSACISAPASTTVVVATSSTPYPTIAPAGNGTSTVYVTSESTIYSCAASVTDCPARTSTSIWAVPTTAPTSITYTMAPIPTATTTMSVTVPCETANTASLSSFMSSYSSSSIYTPPLVGTITASVISTPTPSSVSNGTYTTAAPSVITANSGSMTAPSMFVGLAAVAFLALLL